MRIAPPGIFGSDPAPATAAALDEPASSFEHSSPVESSGGLLEADKGCCALDETGERGRVEAEPPTPGAFPYGDLDPALASAAQEAAGHIRSLLRTEVVTAIEIGRALLAIKARLPHGQFSPWLRAEFGWSERTAQRYMRLSQAFGAKPDTVSDLPVAVLHRLAATSTKPEVREAILSRLEAGERLRAEDILKLLRPEPPQVQQQDTDSAPEAAGPEASGPQPDESTATTASVTQENLPAAQAAQAAARIIIARLGSDLDWLAEMLVRADPHHLVETILSGLHQQHDAGRAFDQSNPEGEHNAQPEILPTGKGESVGPGEAASDAPAWEDVDIAPSAADPGCASPATVADIPSGSGTASANGVDSLDLTACRSPTQSEADALVREGEPASAPRPSPAMQTPIRTSGADRAHGGRSNEPTFRRMGTRGRRDKQPSRPAQG